ncbi:hypothetical protein CF168_01770 [Shewanella bicestrii]|uniref:Type I restriction modification DNA specificity domain-containing protein n=1 Tax=Shewanella bicestrii TaxID=2018305 RepID=A0A220UHG3_9GAMM|nr:restriction endonuclease subunit S [Shewanella bicestrii]ASK67684.1 hypothetical protein CF168_01770 [Shewanella bicestrii]
MSERVPDGWMLKIVRDTSKLSAGGTPSTQVTEYWENGTIPWMSSGEVHKKRVHSVDNCITTLGLENSSAKMFPSKSILVALAGQGKTRGTVAISEIELTTNQSIAAIIVKDKSVYPDFLYHNLDSRYEELRGVSGGSGRAGLNLAILGDLDVLLPPLPEQQKIAKILTSVDEVIDKTQAQIDKLKDLKTGMMQELLTQGVCIDGQPHTEFKDSPVGRIPNTWRCKKLGELVIEKGLQTGPFGSQLHSHEYIESGIPVVMPKDMKGNRVSKDSIAMISKEKAEELDKHRVVEGDILFSRRGDIGRFALIEEQNSGWVCGTGALRVRVSSELNASFLAAYLTLKAVIEWLNVNAVGQTMLNLNTSILAELPVVVPSKSEQLLIAKTLKSIDDNLNTKLGRLEQLDLMKKALMQDLLTGKVRVTID